MVVGTMLGWNMPGPHLCLQNARIRLTFSEWAKSWTSETKAGEMAEWEERLVHNHKDLGSDPSTHVKSRLPTVTVEKEC